MTPQREQWEGGCHCGSIRYRLGWPQTGEAMPARRCTCSFCTRFDGTWTSHPDAVLELVAQHPPGRYRFGTSTADFVFCSRCGVVVAAIDDTSDSLLAVVNVLTLDRFADIPFDHSDSCFDGETVENRLDRRRQRWIQTVNWEGR